MKKGNRLVKYTLKDALKEKLKAALKHLFSVNTFLGLLFLTIIAGVIVGVILLIITNYFNGASSNATTVTNQKATRQDTILNDIPTDDAVSNSTPADIIINGTAPSDAISNESTPDDTISDDLTFYNISNGTMPRGTMPISVPATAELDEILAIIKKLSVGSSKDWIDRKLGPPYATDTVDVTDKGRVRYDYNGGMIDVDGSMIGTDSIVGEFLECVYMFDDFVSVTIYFDTSDNSCKAFFVTLLQDTLDIDIVMPEIYSPLVSNKSLGEFTFTDVRGEPESIYGYASQGVGRVFYGEEYYFAGSGNYQNFYFAVIDYGMLKSIEEFYGFLSLIQFDINPSDDVWGLPASKRLIYQRNKFYPNTYGISSLNIDQTFSILGSYVAFDSLPLRGWD